MIPEFGHALYPGMTAISVVRQQLGQCGAVQIRRQMTLGNHQRHMRGDETDEQRPGLAVAISGALAQPALGAGGDALVVAVVAGRAGAKFVEDRRTAARRRQRIAQRAPDQADAILDVHRFVLRQKTGGIGGDAEMQFADRFGAHTGSVQTMVPARPLPFIGQRIVPIAAFMNVPAGSQRGAGRHADRAGCPGAIEAGAACRQGIQIGRGKPRGARGAEITRIMLVGDDDQQVAALAVGGLRSGSGTHRRGHALSVFYVVVMTISLSRQYCESNEKSSIMDRPAHRYDDAQSSRMICRRAGSRRTQAPSTRRAACAGA